MSKISNNANPKKKLNWWSVRCWNVYRYTKKSS